LALDRAHFGLPLFSWLGRNGSEGTWDFKVVSLASGNWQWLSSATKNAVFLSGLSGKNGDKSIKIGENYRSF